MRILHKYVVAILFLFAFKSFVFSQSCYQVRPNTNYFTCGVPTNEFEYMRATGVLRTTLSSH